MQLKIHRCWHGRLTEALSVNQPVFYLSTACLRF